MIDEKPRTFWVSGIDFNCYKAFGDSVVTGFLTDNNPGKAEAIHVIEKSYADGLAERLAEAEEVIIELRWFHDKVCSYVVPGEADTQDAAKKLFESLRAQNEVLKRACEFYAQRPREIEWDDNVAMPGKVARQALQDAEQVEKGELNE